MTRIAAPISERLERRRDIDQSTGCWNWTGARTPKGYGQIRLVGGTTAYTHREAYMAYVGQIPEGLHLDHLCRNRSCFNPEHLEPVTPRENARRGLTGAHLRREVR
jgi:hypothetical protein